MTVQTGGSMMRSWCLIVALIAAGASQAASPGVVGKADVANYARQELAANYSNEGPGAAIIVARGDDILFRGARGLGDVEAGMALKPESVFEIGSITKQFAAAGLLKLIESGKASLEDPLSKFVGGFPNGDAITVRELLNHTSGIKNYTDKPQQAADGIATRDLIATFENDAPDFAPGTNWAYDNSGYVLVGAVIEAISGKSWHVYLHDTLFVPLGLEHTAYFGDSAVKAVRGYTLVDGKAGPATAEHAVHADGALVSNVDDLLKWNRALHRGRVLSADSYRGMITPVGAAAAEQYGFALWHTTLRNRPMIAHSGHISGFSAYLLYLPDSDVSVAMLQNMDRDASFADPSLTARRVAAFAIGDPYPTPSTVAVDAATLQQAQGVYGVDPPGPRDGSIQSARMLRVIDGKLMMSRSGDSRSELMPIGTDTFQSKSGLDRLRLQRGSEGAITSLRLFPQGEGEGVVLARSSQVVQSMQAAVDLPPAALARVAGTYVAEGLELRVFVEGGRLKGQVPGQPAAEVRAESASRFFATDIDATLEFAPPDGPAQRLTLRQGREVMELKRKE
jgi:CubicO group peptidase (beta-lactamase class C family)